MAGNYTIEIEGLDKRYANQLIRLEHDKVRLENMLDVKVHGKFNPMQESIKQCCSEIEMYKLLQALFAGTAKLDDFDAVINKVRDKHFTSLEMADHAIEMFIRSFQVPFRAESGSQIHKHDIDVFMTTMRVINKYFSSAHINPWFISNVHYINSWIDEYLLKQKPYVENRNAQKKKHGAMLSVSKGQRVSCDIWYHRRLFQLNLFFILCTLARYWLVHAEDVH